MSDLKKNVLNNFVQWMNKLVYRYVIKWKFMKKGVKSWGSVYR